MSYAGPGYGRPPHHSNVGYGNEFNNNHRPNYNPNQAPGYRPNYDRDYPPPRHNGYGGQHGSQVVHSQVLPAGAQYITGGRNYYPRHSRNSPVIISGDGHQMLGRHSGSHHYIHSNSRYRAEGDRGNPVAVVVRPSPLSLGPDNSTLFCRMEFLTLMKEFPYQLGSDACLALDLDVPEAMLANLYMSNAGSLGLDQVVYFLPPIIDPADTLMIRPISEGFVGR
ncbi:hypothetical protein BU17DRAFT_80007 [Hysterangium stoloniferum]|nr:hypothetical protein BU17DRAFT_80007 [Hysterangium stoloniferum]